MQPKPTLLRSPVVLCAALVLAACAQPGAPKEEVGVRRAAVLANGGFESDGIGVSPASWTIEKYLNNKVTPLAPGPNNNLGLLAVPPTSIAQLNLTANAGGLNTFTVGAATVESLPDPDLGAAGSLRFPKFGTRSVVVNPGGLDQGPTDALPTGRNRSVSSMKQTMTLSAGDVDPIDGAIHIRFVAAPVLEDPGHTNYEQPYFYIQVRNVTRNTILYSNFNFAGQAGVAWKSNAGNTIKYTDWQLVDVAPGLNAALGEQVELIVFAAGCSRNGHWGRVYVDAFGTTIPGLYVSGTAPASSPSNADLTYTLNYRNGGAAPVAGTTVTFNTPPNTTFVSSAGATCSNPGVGNAGAVTCTIGALAAGAGGTFTVTVRIAAGVTGLLTAQNYFVQATGVNPLIGSKIDTIVYSGPATLSVVSGTPQSATVNTAFGADLVVVARDSANQPISGLTVSYAGPGSGASATFPLSFAVTGANGQAALRPTANTTAGSYAVGATVPGIAQTASFTLTNTAGTPTSISVVSGTPQSRTVGQAFAAPLVVVVRDAFGNPVQGATVTVATPGAGASATTTAAAATNAAGQTQVTPTANTTAGTYNVTLSVAGVLTPATFALTNTAGAPASVTVVSGTPQSRTVGTAFTAPLVVVVRDAFGNPVQGATVTFTPPASGASATLSSAATTNAAGQTQVTATANTTAGAYTVSASIGVGTPASFALTNTAGTPASLTITSGAAAQSAVVLTTFAQPLTVVVRDANSNPVSGVAVTFAAPGAGPSATFTGSTTTNALGQVSVTATANAVAGGPYSATATVASLPQVSFPLTNTPGAPAAIAVVSGTPQSATVGTAFPAPLVVVVTDAQGNVVPGATVTFTPPASGASAAITGTFTTNAQGRVSVTATANGTEGGPYTVAATVTGASAPANFALTNGPAAPQAPTITSPTEGAVLTDSTPDVSGTAAPNAQVKLFADGGATPVCTATANASGAWSCTVAPALADGQHVFVASTSNSAGVTASSPPRTVSLDATAPATPVITAPTEGATTSASPTISGSAEPGASVRIYLDGSATPACTATADAAGAYSCVVLGPLAPGAHAVTADATDAAGNASAKTAARNFTVAAATPPGPPVITGPARGTATSDTTPTVSGTATPGAEVRVYVDGSSTPACTTTASATGTWSCDVSPALADGPHVLVATATTPNGTSPPSLSTPFTVDGAAPAAPVITAPAANANTSDRPVYAGTAEPGSAVSVFVDGSTTAACTTTANAAGAWSCAGATPLSAGPHTVTASARDAAGNGGPLTAPTPFTVGAGVAPEAPVVTAPAAGASTSDTTPTFSGTAAPLSSVAVKVDGTTVCTTTADAQGQFSCAPAAPLAEGPHQVTATAGNGNGTSPASTAVPFTVDTGAPAAPVITAPTAGQVTGSTPTISGTAEAGSTVVVRVDGQPVCEVVADSTGKFSCAVSRPLAPGAHEATASATDAGGNQSATAAPTPFTVVAAPAVPVLQQPAEGSTTSTRTPTFSGLADPGATVEVSVDGTVVCTATADVMGRFSCTPTAPLADGPHSATVKATTPGGTATSAASTFTVAIVPVITAPADGSSGTDTTPTFSGTAEPGSTVTVKVDGMTACTTTADAQGRFSCDAATPLAPGPHSATATATTGGNTSAPSAPVGFTVQGGGPVLVSPTEGSTTGEFPTFSGTARPNATVSVLVDGAVVCTTTADAQGNFGCTGESALPKGARTVTVRDDGTGLTSTPTQITVVARSLVGGGCATTGGTPLVWLAALALMALASQRRRGAALAVVRARPANARRPDAESRGAARSSLLHTGLSLVLALAALTASPARAQANAVPAFELERVRLSGGAQHGLLVESADLLPKFGYRVALTFHYQKDPLVAREDGQRVGSVVSSRIGVHLSGAFSFTDWLDVSLQVPLVLSQAGEDLSAKGYAPVYGGVVAGTPWVGVRGGILQERRGHAVDLSVGVALGIPLASAAALTRDDSVSVIPSIGIGRTVTSWLRVGGSVGFLVRNAQILTQSTSVNDQVGSLVTPGIILSTLGDGLRGELSARFDVPFTRAPFGAEVDVGLRYPLFGLLEVYAVGGPGFGTLPGTPSVRVLAGLALAPRAKAKPVCVEGQTYVLAECPELDLDGDGIANGRDACATVPGIAARQGCPDVDSDGDGVLDADDACPNVKGLKERQGCPEADADGDGVADAADACPNLAGPAALQGCPDSDGDGITDALDACPKVKGLVELKGCPDLDSDGDGVVDRVDACLKEPGPAENAGCPAAKEQLVVISKERLVIKDKVNFATGKSVVLPKSFTLLEQVARILKEHPEVERVSIEGHTDSRGNREQNLKLSQSRAEAVRQWLLEAGIPAERMSSKGFGPDRPLQTNDTDAGREANRRVDFVIVGAETTKAP